MTRTKTIALHAALLVTAATSSVAMAQSSQPAASADARAQALLQQLTEEEKQDMVVGAFSTRTAGIIRGVPDKGFPDMLETDSSTGVFRWLTPIPYVSLPSSTSMAATFDTDLIADGYAMVAREARASGITVLLAPAFNLVRELRGGRTYEYFGEDPLLSGSAAAAAVRGTQREHVIATLKHYAVNDQESSRHTSDSIVGEAELRESDLLAFELATEAEPGAVMCSYNKVNGTYGCMSDYLMNDVLKQEWGFKGFVMTDWGAVTDPVVSANAGLDLFSAGVAEDGGPNPLMPGEPSFGQPLVDAIAAGEVPVSRRDDMVFRILRSAFANGVVDNPPIVQPLAVADDIATSRRVSQDGMVLIKNDGILPLGEDVASLALIGARADAAVVTKITALPGKPRFPFPPESDVERRAQEAALQDYDRSILRGIDAGEQSEAAEEDRAEVWRAAFTENHARPTLWAESSPMRALQQLAPNASIAFDEGVDPAAAAAFAAQSQIAVVFVVQDINEGEDLRSLRLNPEQEALITAVAEANPNTVVVLENGTAVTMPWADKVRGILAAWFPGSGGGEAIADILTGRVNPSGKLPISFPVDERDQPRPDIPGQPDISTDNQLTTMNRGPQPEVAVDYTIEGAQVGYKWFHSQNHPIAYPFGHGLSYTTFAYSDVSASRAGDQVEVRFTLRNTGDRAGKEAAQVYLAEPFRLVAFDKVELQPNESREVSITLDPRLVSRWDEAAKEWKLIPEQINLLVGTSSKDIRGRVMVDLR